MKLENIQLIQIVVSLTGILLSGFHAIDGLFFVKVFEPEYWYFLSGFIVILIFSILIKKQ